MHIFSVRAALRGLSLKGLGSCSYSREAAKMLVSFSSLLPFLAPQPPEERVHATVRVCRAAEDILDESIMY